MTDPSAHRYVKQVCLRTHVRPLLFFWRKLRTHVRPLLFSGGSCGYLRAHASRHQRTHKRTHTRPRVFAGINTRSHMRPHGFGIESARTHTYPHVFWRHIMSVATQLPARLPSIKKEHLQGLGFPGFSGLGSKRVSPEQPHSREPSERLHPRWCREHRNCRGSRLRDVLLGGHSGRDQHYRPEESEHHRSFSKITRGLMKPKHTASEFSPSPKKLASSRFQGI